LALAVQQKATHLNAAPVAALAPAQRSQHLFRERLQALTTLGELFRSHT
jgi:hypothetical protein